MKQNKIIPCKIHFEGPQPMLIVDPISLQINNANTAAASFWGYAKEILFTKKVSDIIISDIGQIISASDCHSFSSLVKSDGSIVQNHLSAFPLQISDKDFVCIIISPAAGVNRSGMEEMNTAKVSPDDFSALQSVILSNMSHELRTPLVGILGYSDIIKNEVDNSELKQMAEAIHISGEKLLIDLNMVLNLSAIEAGLTKLFFSEADIGEIILKVIRKLKNDADKKDISLIFNCTYRELIVKTDKELIFDAFYYIIDNAIKFTKNGKVTIDLYFFLKEKKNYYTIQVTDTGIGMSAEKQQIIYNAFKQISEGSNRTYDGLGIGLTVAKKIVDMFGGEITFVSKLGEGSSFTLLFPA